MNRKLLDHNKVLALEPDRDRLQRAYELLSSDIARAMIELEHLAGMGSILAMEYLGRAHLRPPHVDLEASERWLKQAHEKGSLAAALSLGGLYYRARNFEAAEQIFFEAAANDDGAAMYWLARIHMRPGNTEANYAEIRDLLQRAMAKGQVRAKNTLSFLLMKGRYGLKEVPRGLALYASSLIDAFRVGMRDPEDPRLW